LPLAAGIQIPDGFLPDLELFRSALVGSGLFSGRHRRLLSHGNCIGRAPPSRLPRAPDIEHVERAAPESPGPGGGFAGGIGIGCGTRPTALPAYGDFGQRQPEEPTHVRSLLKATPIILP